MAAWAGSIEYWPGAAIDAAEACGETEGAGSMLQAVLEGTTKPLFAAFNRKGSWDRISGQTMMYIARGRTVQAEVAAFSPLRG
jgi:hypothetical protein